MSVRVLPEPAGKPSDDWQHVVEVSLASGGSLEVFGWGDDTPLHVVSLPTGPVRLRAHWKGLVADRFEGLDDDGRSEETLALLEWSAPPTPRVVVRRWEGWPW